ncbi:MAG: hypothetical protein FWE72_02435 [Spirochaetaceae bacterium]|nr:hypothetical protein [Spirochaetaceae bacterium]
MLLNPVFDFFFPVKCSLCGAIVRNISNNKLFCKNCAEIIPEIYPDDNNKCRVCSRELISEIDICTICRKRKYHFSKNISLWDYNNHYIKTLIHNYKFKDKKKIAYFFAYSIFKIYSSNTDFKDIPVIPAPCSRKRIIKYGWDHMKYLSSILSKKYSIKIFHIFTKKKTKDQKELDYEKRQTTLINQIKVSDKIISKCLKISNIAIFIDDVFTTGATASYCSKLLLDHGFNKIIVITLALD